MIFTCKTTNLNKAIQTVQRAISSKPSTPIFSGIHLIADNNILEIQAMDLNMAIACSIEAEIQEKQDALCRIEPKIGRITRAIESLPDNERKIIEGKYLDGLTWERLASNMCSSITYCRTHADKAVETLAIALYGPSAFPSLMNGLEDLPI